MAGDIQQRLASIEWSGGRFFNLDGVRFALEDWGDPYHELDAYAVMKPRAYLEAYGRALAGLEVRNMVELGIRQGGSAIFFALLFQPEKLVSIDISKRVKRLDRFRAEDPRGRRIAAYYHTSQDDAQALSEILERETDGPLDLVIDDASHEYGPSRRSFEILFPRLRPGGCYVIEDWQWAHVMGGDLWSDEPALTNLVFQLQMILPSRPELIAEVTVLPGLAFIRKGRAEASTARLDLDVLCVLGRRKYTLF